jgi:hypothetical protein
MPFMALKKGINPLNDYYFIYINPGINAWAMEL